MSEPLLAALGVLLGASIPCRGLHRGFSVDGTALGGTKGVSALSLECQGAQGLELGSRYWSMHFLPQLSEFVA